MILLVPNSLTELICSQNQITKLDNLPSSLIKLDCYCIQITNLDNLPKLDKYKEKVNKDRLILQIEENIKLFSSVIDKVVVFLLKFILYL